MIIMNNKQLFRFHSSVKTNNVLEADVQRNVTKTLKDTQNGPASSNHMSSQKSTTFYQPLESEQNMSTLHAKLHQEADKIRKWKIQTELDLKDKDKKLTEASVRIETMKKSLLELQLDNEKTSTKLQEEISNRDEVIRKINATREMCSFLKSHASKMEVTLTKCETEKTELKYVGRENMQHFEELTLKFRELQVTVEETEKRIQDEVNIEKNDKMLKEKAMETKLTECNGEIQTLRDALEVKNSEIHTLQTSLKNAGSKLETTEKLIGDLQSKIGHLSDELSNKEEELKDSSLRISEIQEEKSKLETKMNNLKKEFECLQLAKEKMDLETAESVTILEDQLKVAVEETKETNGKLEEEQKRLTACEKELTESKAEVESLKSSKDMLMLEKTDIDMNLDLLRFQMKSLKAETDIDKGEIHRLNGEITVLTKKLDREMLCKHKAQEESEALEGKLSALELEYHDSIEEIDSLKSKLSVEKGQVESMQNLLSEEEKKRIKLQSKFNILEQKLATDSQLLQEVQGALNDIKDQLSEKDVELCQKHQELERTQKLVQDLMLTNQELERAIADSNLELKSVRCITTAQEDKIQELTSQLDSLTEERKETGKSLTSQQKRVTSTTKQNKELEKQVKNLKSTLEKGEKTVDLKDTEIEQLQEKVNLLQKEKEDADQEHKRREEELNTLKQICEQDREAAGLAMKKAEEMEENARKEKENAVALTDYQLAEMMATLDIYKKNNEKLISEKDNEMQSLRMKLEQAESLALNHKKDQAEWKKEVEKLSTQHTANLKEKEDLMWQLTSKSDEMQYLKNKVGNLEIQIISVKASTAEQTPVKLATSLTQTPGLGKPDSLEDLHRKKSQQSPHVATVTPQTQIPQTPKRVTPKPSTIKTPQRSILRVCNSVPKRRKVVFEQSQDGLPSSSEESDVMELDSMQAVLATKTSFKPSPSCGRATPKSLPSKIPVNQVLKTSLGKQSISKPDSLQRESSATATLFSRKDPGETDDLMKSDGNKTPNIRKAPAKKPKFFSTSPKNKAASSKTKIKEKKNMQQPGQMAWFDLDSVYGFGPED